MEPETMNTFVTALTAVITPAALWGVLSGIAAFVGAMILFSLGMHYLRRVTSGASKGKAKF